MFKTIFRLLGVEVLVIYFRKFYYYFDRKEQVYNEKRKKFYSQFLSKSELCFDVGANVGNRIYALLALGAKVVAVEPQPKCIKYLRILFGNKITIVPKGLDAKEGVQKMYVSDATVVSSFSESWIDSVKKTRLKSFSWNKTLPVQMTTLDNLIKAHGVPKFIKIDVEGFELQVLQGLSYKIPAISFEYTVPEQTQSVIDCLNQLKRISNDYHCNYSVGENMTWALEHWKRIDDMLDYITRPEFIQIGFGDVYVRLKN